MAAEKVGPITLIHLPENLHFVELIITGNVDYYAEWRESTTTLFPSMRKSGVYHPETDMT